MAGGTPRLPHDRTAFVSLIGSGSSPPESDLATAPATPPAGAVPCCPPVPGNAASSTASCGDPLHRRSSAHARGVAAEHVVVVTRDHHLATEIRRLCAVAGQAMRVVGELAEAVRLVRRGLLVVDARADDGCEVPPVRPAEVIVVTDDTARLDAWRTAVRLSARHVVSMPGEGGQLLDLLALAAEPPGSPGPLVGVVGGRGGAGASTVAVALAWAAAQNDVAATLVDLDAWGGGLDVAVGLERVGGLRWPELGGARGVVASAALREQLPTTGGVAVVSVSGTPPDDGERSAEPLDVDAVRSVVDAARRGEGAVIVDLPRWPGACADGVVQECDVVFLVVPADVRSVAASRSVGRRVRSLCDDVRIVLRLDGQCRLKERDVVAAIGYDHAATVTTETRIAVAADRGELVKSLPRSRLGRSARSLFDALREPAA